MPRPAAPTAKPHALPAPKGANAYFALKYKGESLPLMKLAPSSRPFDSP